jgi:hypothetical protein
VQLLILDDWGLEPLDAAARHDLLEILEERYGRRSTIITSQIPVDKWHELIRDPLCRRHPRSPRPQRSPDQSHRPQPATLASGQGIQGLTAPVAECKKLSASEAPNPGDIMSERRATSSRNAWAASSESAEKSFAERAPVGRRDCCSTLGSPRPSRPVLAGKSQL